MSELEQAQVRIAELEQALDETKQAWEQAERDAYEFIRAERTQWETVVSELIAESDQKVAQAKDFIVRKVDEYLKAHDLDDMRGKDVVVEAVVRDGDGYVQQDEVYLHIGNSGVTIRVASTEHGPMLVIESSAFGNNKIRQEVYATSEGLRQVGEMLVAAADWAFTAPYCHAATPGESESRCSGDDGKVSMETKCLTAADVKVAREDPGIEWKEIPRAEIGRTLPGADKLGFERLDIDDLKSRMFVGLCINPEGHKEAKK